MRTTAKIARRAWTWRIATSLNITEPLWQTGYSGSILPLS